MLSRKLIGWVIAFAVAIVRMTCRARFHNDRRPELKKKGQTYIYCILHAQQLGAVFGRERKTGAMVSRSADGEILVPSLRIRGIKPFRGSSNKGGMKAFEQMVEHSAMGLPTYFAVDGPRGPRGYVQRGIADLAQQTNSCVLVTMALPTRRWILPKAWDRFQIPKPFSRVDVTFAEPLYMAESEPVLDFRKRVNDRLLSQEKVFDADEAVYSTGQKRTRVKTPQPANP